MTNQLPAQIQHKTYKGIVPALWQLCQYQTQVQASDETQLIDLGVFWSEYIVNNSNFIPLEKRAISTTIFNLAEHLKITQIELPKHIAIRVGKQQAVITDTALLGTYSILQKAFLTLRNEQLPTELQKLAYAPIDETNIIVLQKLAGKTTSAPSSTGEEINVNNLLREIIFDEKYSLGEQQAVTEAVKLLERRHLNTGYLRLLVPDAIEVQTPKGFYSLTTSQGRALFTLFQTASQPN